MRLAGRATYPGAQVCKHVGLYRSLTLSRPSSRHHEQSNRLASLVASAKGGDSFSANLAETAALDQIIDLLMNAKDSEQVTEM
jgi:hypothetical protein